MLAVHNYAVDGGGQAPRDLSLYWNIERYGVEAVMGRPYLGVREIRHMNAAANIYDACRSRAAYRDESGSPNWAEWAQKNPTAAQMLLSIAEIDDE